MWHQDAAFGPLEELGYIHNLRHSSSGTSNCIGGCSGNEIPRCHTYQSLPSVYPCGAHLGREDGRAWGGPYVQAIGPDKSQGRRPSHSVADVLQWDTCKEGLGGHHTPSGMSLDSHRRGEVIGLIGHVFGIHDPPTEGLLGSRKTSFKGTIAYWQLVRLSPWGSSLDVCARTGHIQLSFCWSGSRKEGGLKACSTTGCGVTKEIIGTYPARGYKKTLAIPAQSPNE